MSDILEVSHEIVVVARFFDRVLERRDLDLRSLLARDGKLTLILPANNELIDQYEAQRQHTRSRRDHTIEYLKTLSLISNGRNAADVELRLYERPINNTIIRVDGVLFLVGLQSHNHSDNDDLPTVIFESRGLDGPAIALAREIRALLVQTDSSAIRGTALQRYTESP